MNQLDHHEAPIINCHTHIFTVKDVPPFLAKSIVPWPLHLIVRADAIAALIKIWTVGMQSLYRKRMFITAARNLQHIKIALKRYFVFRVLKSLIIFIILLSVFYDQFDPFIKPWLKGLGIQWMWLDEVYRFLDDMPFVIKTESLVIKILLFLGLLILFPLGRNIVIAILRQTNAIMRLIPGKQTKEIILRYLNIAFFANYKEQFNVYSKLCKQYPPGTKMVILPMDMRFMGAGKPARSYYDQMAMLAKIKEAHPEALPFVFVDPRRMKADGIAYFNYKVVNDKVILEECFIKKYIEDKNFSGFKIYPALGYYPFDELLLPLWKYAADNGIPIMTHCIRGVIYYRNKKEKEWDYHPVFEQFLGRNKSNNENDWYRRLSLPQMKPVEVQEIFTHPLNYICLYKKELLQILVERAKDSRVKTIFGYNEKDKTITRGLGHLKICFGHFGGDDEWKQFFEKDRANFGHHLITYPNKGIEFLRTASGALSRGLPEQVWKTADWYSIICSLMLQHPNVYADISYILHGDQAILPLLRSTLQHPELKYRVLYGSDFFVVRNHKSDKNMFADIKGGLLSQEFDLIARKNPVVWLKKGDVVDNATWRPKN